MALGRTREALAAFAQTVKFSPTFGTAHGNLALATLGRTTEALDRFETATTLDPGHADAQLNWPSGSPSPTVFPRPSPISSRR